MKTARRIVLLSALALAMGFLFSCGDMLTTTSISTRLSDFVTSLNGDRTGTYLNFESTVKYYDAIKSPSTTWDVWFAPGDEPFAVSGTPDTSNALSVIVTITGSGGFTNTYVFSFVNAGTVLENWMISDITVQSSGQSLFYGL